MWEKLINEIMNEASYNLSQVAQAIKVKPEALRKLYRGKTLQPKLSTGHSLFALHFKLRPDLYIISKKSGDDDQPEKENGI